MRFALHSLLAVALIAICSLATAQNAILANFGSNTCAQGNAPQFSLIKEPLSTNPLALINCPMSP